MKSDTEEFYIYINLPHQFNLHLYWTILRSSWHEDHSIYPIFSPYLSNKAKQEMKVIERELYMHYIKAKLNTTTVLQRSSESVNNKCGKCVYSSTGYTLPIILYI